MLKWYYFKEPIDKNDFKAVVLNGLIASIIAGILGGTLDFLMYKINVQIELGLFLVCFAVGFRMKRAYKNYHILYPMFSILFLLLGLFIDGLIYYIFYYWDFSVYLKEMKTLNFYLNILFTPIMNMIILFKDYSTYKLIIEIINIAIYFVAFQTCYKIVKGTI